MENLIPAAPPAVAGEQASEADIFELEMTDFGPSYSMEDAASLCVCITCTCHCGGCSCIHGCFDISF